MNAWGTGQGYHPGRTSTSIGSRTATGRLAGRPVKMRRAARRGGPRSGQFRLLGQVEPARLDAPAGEAGTRQRTRRLAAGTLGGRRRAGDVRRRRGGVGGAEDLVLALAVEQ